WVIVGPSRSLRTGQVPGVSMAVAKSPLVASVVPGRSGFTGHRVDDAQKLGRVQKGAAGNAQKAPWRPPSEVSTVAASCSPRHRPEDTGLITCTVACSADAAVATASVIGEVAICTSPGRC